MPLDQVRQIYRFQQGYGDMLLGAMDAKDAFVLACDGGVHPAWIIGHLATVGHGMSQRLGGAGVYDDEAAWKSLFGGGSTPTAGPDSYPPFDEIVDAWRRGHDALDAAAANVAPNVLAEPTEHERLKGALPTLGDFVAFLMTGHEGMHLGQLSTWRRIRGMPPLF